MKSLREENGPLTDPRLGFLFTGKSRSYKQSRKKETGDFPSFGRFVDEETSHKQSFQGNGALSDFSSFEVNPPKRRPIHLIKSRDEKSGFLSGI